MDALRQIIAHFGIEVDTKQVEKGDTLVDHLIGKLGHFGHAVAGVFAFHQIEAFVEATVNEARELAKSAVMAGMAADELQRLQHAANMADVSAGSLSAGLKFMQRNAYAASEGSAETAHAFKLLGIEFKKGDKIDTTDLLYRTADAIAAIDDPAKQTAAAMSVFGRGGLEMVPMLKKGSEGIRQYAEELDHLGGGFSEEFMRLSEQFEDSGKELKMVWRSVKSQIVGQLIPAMLRWQAALKDLGLWAMKLNKDGSLMRVAWAGAIWAIAVKLPGLISLMRGFAASALLPMAGLVLMALAAEDLLTWFQGGDSVIGRFFGLFDEGINSSAVEFADFVAFAFSSVENLKKALMIIPSAVGMVIKVTDNEIDIWLSSLDARILDWWDSILDQLHIPNWLQKIIGSDYATGEGTTGNNVSNQEAAANASRARLGDQFRSEMAGGSWADFQKAMAAKREGEAAEKGWAAQGFDARNGAYHWNAALGAPEAATMPVPPASIARTEITDNSKTEVHVTVPGTTPANIVPKIGAAVAKATKTDYNGAGMSLEHTVD